MPVYDFPMRGNSSGHSQELLRLGSGYPNLVRFRRVCPGFRWVSAGIPQLLAGCVFCSLCCVISKLPGVAPISRVYIRGRNRFRPQRRQAAKQDGLSYAIMHSAPEGFRAVGDKHFVCSGSSRETIVNWRPATVLRGREWHRPKRRCHPTPHYLHRQPNAPCGACATKERRTVLLVSAETSLK